MPLATVLPDAIGSGLLLPGQPYAAGGPGGPPPPGAGSGWEVTVLAAPSYYQQLAKLPPRTVLTLQFAKQLSDKGSGTVTLNMDDSFWQVVLPGGLAAHNILDYEHLWQVWQDGVLRFEFFAETVTEQLVDPSEQRIATVTGPGSIAALSWAMAAPPGFPSIIYKLDAITDSFSEVNTSGQLVPDFYLWNLASPTSHIALNPSGTAQVMASPSTTFLGTSVFDATSTLISAQVNPMVSPNAAGATLDGSQLTQFYVQDVNNAGHYFLIGMSGLNFYAQLGDPTGTQTKVISSAANFNTVAANNQAYQYWQISESAGYFYAWTSPDGQNWAQQFKVAHSWNATQVAFYVSAKYDVDNSQFATITSLNSNVTTSSLAGALYFNQPIMSVWLQELQAAQGRGTIPFITTRMSASYDSFGNAWSDSQSVQIQNGTDLFALLQGHASMINAEFVMQPGFVLQVGIPRVTGIITLGADWSQSVILREARDETSKQRTRTRNQIANLIAAINSDGRTVTASNTTSIASWGQREAWIQAAVQVSPTDIDVVAAASVEQTSIEQLQWTLQITPNRPGKTVFRDFDVGDWVGLERPDYSAVDSVQVIAIAVQVDASGVETHELTLVSYLQWLQEQLAYVVGKLGGQFLSVTGTTAVAGGISNLTQPSVYSLTMAGLSNVVGGGAANNAPLVYNSQTGTWVPAGTVNPDTGSTANVTVTGSGGTTTIAPGSHTVTAAGASAGTAADSAGAVPAASVSTTPTGVVIRDPTGTARVVLGQQSDGTVTAVTVNAPPPGQPDAPTVVAGLLGVIVGWDGNLAGAAPLYDFRYVQVHGSTTSGFTPGTPTLQGTMAVGGLFGIGGLTAGTPYYVKLVAVNQSGVASAASAQSTATPLAVGSAITPGSLPGTVIQTGTITSTQISATAGILGSQLSATAGITAGQVAFTAQAIGGGPNVTVGSTAPTSPQTGDLWFNGTAGYQLQRWTGSAWTAYQYGTQAIAAGSVTAALIAAGTITATQIASGTITATQIASSTITAGQIATGTLTAGLFQAGIVLAGIINGTTVTGSTIQNSSTNPRTSINPDGSITITNSAGAVVFKIGPDGTIYWYTAAGTQLLMELQPGGTQLIYGSPTGPTTWDFEGSGSGSTSSWAAVSCTLSASGAWANTGSYSLLCTATGAATWGATSPAFTVQAGTFTTAQAVLYSAVALSAVSVFVTFWSGANGTGTNLGTVAGDQGAFALAATTPTAVTLTGATVPSTAVSATFTVQEAHADTSGTLLYIDTVQVAGGLVYSNSPVPGTDALGNAVPQGINFYGLPMLTNVLGVTDPWGNQLGGIDADGDVTGQYVSAATDVIVQGQSLLNTLLPSLPQGLVSRGWTPGGPWPSTAIGASEVAVLELDVTVPPGRAYLLQVLPCDFVPTTAPGSATQMVQKLHYTTDGSTPTTSSATVLSNPSIVPVPSGSTSNNMSPYMEYVMPYNSSAAQTFRFLLTAFIQSGAFKYENVVEMRVTDLGFGGPGVTTNTGLALGTGTSGGAGSQLYTQSFYPNQTWAYSGAGGLLAVGGAVYCGWNAYNNGGGSCYSFMDFSNVKAAIPSGATITSWSLRMTCMGTYYSGGAVVGIYPSSARSTGSVVSTTPRTQPSFKAGQTNSVGSTTNLQLITDLLGTYTYLMAACNPIGGGSSQYTGYYRGMNATNSQKPMLTVSYTH